MNKSPSPSQQITDPFVEFREALDDIRKFLASQAIKNDTGPKSTVLVEPDILDKLEPEVVELMPLQEKTPWPIEMKESLVEVSMNLPAEPIMELLSSLLAMRVLLSPRSADIYDHLHIFLQQTGSQEIKGSYDAEYNRSSL